MEALAYARLGMTQALARFDRASVALMQSVSLEGEVEPARAVGAQMEAQRQFQANLLAATIADEMMKSLIEVQAER